MVTHDGPRLGKPDMNLARILDNLIAQRRVPPLIAVMVGNGGGDAQGHERGREYDTMSGLYAEFIESEVLPLVQKNCGVKLTKDPEGRATMGNSSGGSAALIMAWYHPELYHRVLTFSSSSPKARRSLSAYFWPLATAIISTPTSCATACTIGWWRTTAWPLCSRPRAITINTSIASMPAMALATRSGKSCLMRWSGFGKVTLSRRNQDNGNVFQHGVTFVPLGIRKWRTQ
jgi:hypothetical protein